LGVQQDAHGAAADITFPQVRPAAAMDLRRVDVTVYYIGGSPQAQGE
jgi:hypothetical protein